MSMLVFNKIWLHRNWKWILPSTTLVVFAFTFFIMTGDATFRYGSVFLQPDLVNNALEKAQENELVIEKLGKLSSHNFFHLLEGEVAYQNNNSLIILTVGIRNIEGKKAKMDIIAHRNGQKWKYQKITVRIKKPKKVTIKILEQ
ncbi:cytochrome c oxidase assembly factor Coa1 family protein [Aquimarina sediminis]|uniref:cytochrome c oxidase assembly factor Coa1 family protein n=1 Tax=Aquimarina sediminis TaxID=2070536 RepID=UPI000CA0044E|nr:cytochrome c oxidase assembly factor Coa1 family protein [Aquimarina sediminis]